MGRDRSGNLTAMNSGVTEPLAGSADGGIPGEAALGRAGERAVAGAGAAAAALVEAFRVAVRVSRVRVEFRDVEDALLSSKSWIRLISVDLFPLLISDQRGIPGRQKAIKKQRAGGRKWRDEARS